MMKTLKNNRFSTLTTETKTLDNDIRKKLTVQWLIKHLYFASNSVVADSLVLRNHELLVVANHCCLR